MEKCCIPSCPKFANLACYNIPMDVKRRNLWMSNINRDKNAPTITDQDAGAVCSLHFKQNDYIKLLHDNGTSKRQISEDAVPSVFPWTSDWGSSYTAEIEIAQPNEKSARQSDSETSSLNAGLSEGEAIQLRNVDSLGVTPHTVVNEDAYLGSSANCLESLSNKNTKNFCVNSMQSKSLSQGIQLSTSTSTSTSRIETSEDEDVKYFDILTQFYYSCTGCEFKSKDIISLKEHRVKHHPQIKSEFTDINGSSTNSPKLGTKSSSQSLLQVSRSSGKEKRVVPSTGKQSQQKSNKNRNSLQQHISKTHSASEVSAVSDSQSNSNKSDPPSASLSASNSRQPLKRSVRKWYPCSQCSFRTPNAKKLKTHVKENHPVPADTSSIQPIKLAAHQTDEIIPSDAAFLDVSISSLKKRLIKGHSFYFCPDTNCPFRSKDSRAVLNHCRTNHPSPLASSDQQPQGMNKTTDSGKKERYFCGLCNFSTHDKKRRMEHDLGHTEDYGYRCSMCSYSVPNNRRLTYHVANHHPSDISCELCDFKAKTIGEKESHCASVHKLATARKSSLRSAEQTSNSDCDLEHVCSQCSFRTSSRDQLLAHEITHVPNTAGSSTEELVVVEDTPRKTNKKMKRKREDRESSSTVQSAKFIECVVYQCPHCSFWARAVSCFHQHLIAHEKTPTFKCSHCDFSARYRIAITKHIKKSAKKTHSSACWVMAKPVSDNQYPEYLKTARVPELEYSGTSGIHILGSGEGLKGKTSSNSSGGSMKLSSESSVEEKSDEESVEWVPSASSLSSAYMKDDSSSSPSSEITSDSSSEYSENHSSTDTPLSSDSKLEAKDKTSKKTTPSTEKPSSRLTSGIVLRSSNSAKGPRRKRLRIDSDDETDQQPRPLKSLSDSRTKDTGEEKRKLDIPDPKNESNMQLQILPDCLKGPFPLLDEAITKRDAKEQMIREAQNKINGMRTEQLKMAEANGVSQSELLKLKGRKNVVIKQLMILNGEKIEAELQLRTQQCQELKLSIAMCEPGQESELNSNVLAECKNLVAESEAKLTEIKGAIANLREESEILDCQIKESEESHAGTAQLVEILQCELSEKEIELNLLQQELAKSVSDIAQLVDKERALIVTRTAMCEEELKRLYEKGLSSIREKEKDLLSALADYITDKNDSPNMKEIV